MQEHTQTEEFSFRNYFVPFTTTKALHWVIVIGIVIFLNGLFNTFIGDDNTQIIDNPSIQSVTNIPTFFFENRLHTGGQNKLGGLYYKPLFDTSYAVTYSVFGPNFFAYHFFQLSLYITNACLLFLLFKQFFDRRIAFLLSVIFLVHPINSETALYIADTQDVLFFFFGMTTLLLLKKYQTQKALIGVSLLLLLSTLSKETGILFIGISLLYSLVFLRKIFLPFFIYAFLATAAYLILRIHAIGFFTHSLISAPIEKLDLGTRMINIPAIFFFYLKTFFFPLALSSSWQWTYTKIDIAHFYVPLILDLIFLSLISSAGFAVYKKSKQTKQRYFSLYLFFVLWFLSGICFHLQILPLDQTVAERWFYFPFVGLLGMIGILFTVYKINLKNKWLLTIFLVIVILLSIRTFVRTFDFRNDFTLASQDIQVPSDSYNAEYIISRTYYGEDELVEAKMHAERSIVLFPYITNYTNLGAIDSRMGEYKEANEAYLKALQYGEDALPYENLASLSLIYGNRKTNIGFIKNTALKKYPEDEVLWFDLAVLEYKYGSKPDAKAAIKQALLYNQNKNPDVNFIDYIISHNKPLTIQVKNGNVTFYTVK